MLTINKFIQGNTVKNDRFAKYSIQIKSYMHVYSFRNPLYTSFFKLTL